MHMVYSGVAMMIRSRGANGSDAEIVLTQILQGFGGGLAAITSQVGAQASVPHADVAMITALILLFTEIGGAVGSAGGECTVFIPGFVGISDGRRDSRCDLVKHDARQPGKVLAVADGRRTRRVVRQHHERDFLSTR